MKKKPKRLASGLVMYILKNMEERVGLEPTWACALTVFKTAPL